jgi:hypothetical protein
MTSLEYNTLAFGWLDLNETPDKDVEEAFFSSNKLKIGSHVRVLRGQYEGKNMHLVDYWENGEGDILWFLENGEGELINGAFWSSYLQLIC